MINFFRFKKDFVCVSIRMVNITLNKMILIVKKRNTDGCKRLSKYQLINLIPPTLRQAFKIEGYIAKLSKRKLKNFIYYNFSYLSPQTKYETYQDLNKHGK